MSRSNRLRGLAAFDPKAHPKNLQQVNKHLRELGLPVRAIAGDGYYYFLDESDNPIDGASVYIHRASQQPFSFWEGDARDAAKKAAEAAERRAEPSPTSFKIRRPKFDGLAANGQRGLAGYFNAHNLPLRDIAKRVKAGDKTYSDKIVMYPVAELATIRDYEWSRTNLRRGSVPVGPPDAEGCPTKYERNVGGPERWDRLREWMEKYGWKCDPAHVYVGRDGKAKLGEGNHRLALAESLGIEKAPTQFWTNLEVSRTSDMAKSPRQLAGQRGSSALPLATIAIVGLAGFVLWKLLRSGESETGEREITGTGACANVDGQQYAPRGCGTLKVTGYINGVGKPITIREIPGSPGYYLQSSPVDVWAAFQRMASAAVRDGYAVSVNSAFRTMARQQALYADYLAGRGNKAAKPGYSTHQNGLAVDLAVKAGDLLSWLRANANGYGFFETVVGENWHWAYDLAKDRYARIA